MKKILIIDDEADLRLLLKRFLTQHSLTCLEAYSGKKAMEVLQNEEVDLVLCDFKLNDMNGSEVLQSIKELYPTLPVIIMTGYSNVRSAVEVMQLGAIDYITKPLIPAEILATINATLNQEPATLPNKGRKEALRTENKRPLADDGYILSPNEAFQNILKQIDLVGPTDYCVIIYGESGSGKEAFAQEIHKRSKRKNKPFHAIDCGVLSKELSGSTLFGHEKGAFTGAISQKIGGFELAEGGTIFLDEIINLSYDVQVSLLRVIQERKMRRVGGTKDIEIDVRIIVASNKKLWPAAQAGEFREDLYHRFNEFTIDVLPLRERPDDVMFYAKHFLKITNSELDKNVAGFSPEVIDIFMRYAWPGNLRELKNVVKRAVLLTDTQSVEPHALPFELLPVGVDIFNPSLVKDDAPITVESPVATTHKTTAINQLEADYQTIVATLQETSFNRKKAAQILNIDTKTLSSKMKEYADLKGLS